MFELTVQTVFSAAHAITVAGERETLHGHDWQVTACVTGRKLDSDGLIIDFHAVEECLASLARAFRNANLNETAPFDRTNPTAENVARHLAEGLRDRLDALASSTEGSARGVRVAWVRVTEAPGCAVTYRLPETDGG